MPEFPETGQLNKFFGKNGFPPLKRNTLILGYSRKNPHPSPPPMEGMIFNPPPPGFLKQEGQKKHLNRIKCCHNDVINPSRKTIFSYFVFNDES